MNLNFIECTKEQYNNLFPATYTITFNNNDGTGNTTVETMAIGETCSNIPTPTRTNYTFNGWFTAAEGGSLIDNSNIGNIQTDTVLYAHWTYGITVVINQNLAPNYGLGQAEEVTTNSSYGAKTIKYTDPDGNTQYQNPENTGSIQVAEGSRIYLMMRAGNNSTSSSLYLYDGTRYISSNTGASGRVLSCSYTVNNPLFFDLYMDFYHNIHNRYSWTVYCCDKAYNESSLPAEEVTITIANNLAPTTKLGQNTEITSSSSYGAKTIKYTDINGLTQYWNPEITGSFKAKKHTAIVAIVKFSSNNSQLAIGAMNDMQDRVYGNRGDILEMYYTVGKDTTLSSYVDTTTSWEVRCATT